MTQNDLKFFNRAKLVSEFSDYPKTHVGCVAVYQGKIIGFGYNSNKTHPLQKRYNRYRNFNNKASSVHKLHAEILCLSSISHLDIKFNRVKLYIYRTRHDQPFGMARPCPACMNAIRDMGIKDIYYTTNEGFAYESLVIER